MTVQVRAARGSGVFLSALFVLAGCSHVNPYYDATKAHHQPQGFRNVDPQAVMPRPFSMFVRWQWDRLGLDIAAPKMDLSPLRG